ncbi:MAG: hypothetical protein LBE49_03330 [Deltaproteobacteria bacterium]|nr:hypothetical protein [Deltaproteobacteria bacterium]
MDASYVWGPFWHNLAEDGGHVILSTGDLNKDGYSVFNAYVVANDFAEKYPELVAAFLKDQRHLGSGY